LIARELVQISSAAATVGDEVPDSSVVLSVMS
jgi:hypothetical protein